MYDAILPAGGTIPEEFAAKVGTNKKPLIQINGRTVLESTIDALRASGLVRRIVVIGSDEVLKHPSAKLADILLAEGATGPENIYKGVDALRTGENPPDRILIVTTDLPFLTPELVKRFVENCPPEKDFCVPLVAEGDFAKRFPGTEATFVGLKDDTYTTGCIYLANVKPLLSAKPHIERVFEQRKSKLGMAKLLGLGFVFKYLTKQMTVDDVEQKIVDLLGCSGAAIRGSAPEFAFDIDYLEDYEYAVANAERFAVKA